MKIQTQCCHYKTKHDMRDTVNHHKHKIGSITTTKKKKKSQNECKYKIFIQKKF